MVSTFNVDTLKPEKQRLPDYREMLQHTEAERKGLLYGSLISAILGAGVSALTGGNWGEAIARGIEAGSAGFSGGSKQLTDYKKMALEALRQQELDRMETETHTANIQKTKVLTEDILRRQEVDKRKQEEEKRKQDALNRFLEGISSLGKPAPQPEYEFVADELGAVTNVIEKPSGAPQQGYNLNNLIAEALRAGVGVSEVDKIASLLGVTPNLKISETKDGNIVAIDEKTGKAKVLYQGKPESRFVKTIQNGIYGELDIITGNFYPIRRATPKDKAEIEGVPSIDTKKTGDAPVPKSIADHVYRETGINISGMTFNQVNKLFGNIPVKNQNLEIMKMALDSLSQNPAFSLMDAKQQLNALLKQIKLINEALGRSETPQPVQQTTQSGGSLAQKYLIPEFLKNPTDKYGRSIYYDEKTKTWRYR